MSALVLSGTVWVEGPPCRGGAPIVSSMGSADGCTGVLVSGFIPDVRSVLAMGAPVVLRATGVIHSPLTGVAGTSTVGLVKGPGS
jgi:regulator of RNase E activity RraA